MNQPTGPIQSLSCNFCQSSVCVFVCAIAENPLPSGMETSGQRGYRYFGILPDIFGFLLFQWLFAFEICWVFFGVLQTSLLSLMGGKVFGCGYCRYWHVTSDTQHATHVMWHMKNYIFFCLLVLSVLFCPFWYRCYYPHTMTESVSPVCGI